VDAAMAESPAEEAGIVRGDRIIEISKRYATLSARIMIQIQFSSAQHSVQEAFDAARTVTPALGPSVQPHVGKCSLHSSPEVSQHSQSAWLY
jgi:predicted metalloprotease with PDZ domain